MTKPSLLATLQAAACCKPPQHGFALSPTCREAGRIFNPPQSDQQHLRWQIYPGATTPIVYPFFKLAASSASPQRFGGLGCRSAIEPPKLGHLSPCQFVPSLVPV
ncbi:hypothetical protein DSO57_1001012 [Entomophthora muscae]|uniref:Uncharacterized protein n=1 Tax=Entomophthora muscae TaxID=34485 RepID=A0ACC2UW07_9FUNG|nr:hypothetical protein DSO57_1001012 [Entomophthora muscae]